jgi:hypothetical protein
MKNLLWVCGSSVWFRFRGDRASEQCVGRFGRVPQAEVRGQPLQLGFPIRDIEIVMHGLQGSHQLDVVTELLDQERHFVRTMVVVGLGGAADRREFQGWFVSVVGDQAAGRAPLPICCPVQASDQSARRIARLGLRA